MRKISCIKLILSLLLFSLARQSISQTAIPPQKKTIFDIPHKTPWEIWMWPHRSVVYMIIREKKTIYNPAYIRSYTKRLTITLPGSVRLMTFNIVDAESKNRLQFAPNYRYDVGIGVSSRWATFIVNSGIIFSKTRNNERGVTKHRDIQLNLYGKRVVSDITYQNYKGFYISNTGDYPYKGSGKYEVRGDIKATLFATNTSYLVNYKKFSYRNSFAFTETQLKSAGSLLFGGFYSIFSMQADSSIVTQTFVPYFDSLSHMKKSSVQTFGLTAGYIYTFVIKKAYITSSIVPGIGLDQTTYERDDYSNFHSPFYPSAKVNFRMGLGYDTGSFYVGIMGMYDYFFSWNKSNTSINYSTGKAMTYVGYRFKYLKTEHRVLKKLKLVDYPGDPRNSK